MFQALLGGLQDEVIRLIFNTHIVPQAPTETFSMGVESHEEIEDGMAEEFVERPNPFAAARAASASGVMGATRPASVRKVGRNDPCPCGSGKKYKSCHGR